jgi:uncharacterized protein YidB (DUF937 family)
MGLLDGIAGNLGSALGGDQSTQGGNPLGSLLNSLGGSQGQGHVLSAVMALIQQNGGLPRVLDMFRGSGLAQQADSWVSTGPNAELSGSQVEQVFGNSGVGNLASQLGTSQGDASSMLAKMLPEIVNQLTPQGRVPDNHSDLLSQGLAMLRGQAR